MNLYSFECLLHVPPQHFMKLLYLAGLALAVSASAAEHHLDISKIDTSKLPLASPKTGLTFAKDIQPMFKESCVRCHGENRPKGGLRLDSVEGVLKGSHDGKVVEPGNSKGSLLVIAAARIDNETAMPPKRGPGKRGRQPGTPGGQGGGQSGTNSTSGKGPGSFGPPSKPLTAEQVGVLRAWVDQGAK